MSDFQTPSRLCFGPFGAGKLNDVVACHRAGMDMTFGGNFPLREAVLSNQLEILEYLIKEAGVDMEAESGFAIRWAARKDNVEIVEWLCQNGADVLVNNQEAVRWAEENYHFMVQDILQSYTKEALKNPAKMAAVMPRRRRRPRRKSDTFSDIADITFEPVFQETFPSFYKNKSFGLPNRTGPPECKAPETRTTGYVDKTPSVSCRADLSRRSFGKAELAPGMSPFPNDAPSPVAGSFRQQEKVAGSFRKREREPCEASLSLTDITGCTDPNRSERDSDVFVPDGFPVKERRSSLMHVPENGELSGSDMQQEELCAGGKKSVAKKSLKTPAKSRSKSTGFGRAPTAPLPAPSSVASWRCGASWRRRARSP
eukprot:TRINITY_DN298_c0_g1_i2.p1 TRINITY_DN298_c0_g1~~TRINITY_DN298_c0_g1_i2.p1  ORF type:complete len:370 (+),score=38.89 TRINITY_DN298_c0_g1_i2:467-1576(+)